MSSTRHRSTHVVLNQAPPRVDVDEYALNPALQEAVAVFSPHARVERFHEIGRHVGVPTPQIDTLLGLVRLHAQPCGLY